MTPEEEAAYAAVLIKIDWQGPLNLAQCIAHGPWLTANQRPWGWEAPRVKKDPRVHRQPSEVES